MLRQDRWAAAGFVDTDLPAADHRGSDLVATVPRDLANICAHHGGIRLVDPPFKSPVVEVHQFWHRRFHQDAANVWLRALVHRLFGAQARRLRRRHPGAPMAASAAMKEADGHHRRLPLRQYLL